jgi:glycosyltransferase involved in cell wall biosynthesis
MAPVRSAAATNRVSSAAMRTKHANSVSLSVVIPVLNAERDLTGCLESILKQQTHSVDYEIVVADGGSTDSTRRIAAEAGARVVDNPYRLAEPGVAVGIKEARGQLITVMAADNRMRRNDFMERIIVPFGDPDVVAAFPRVVSTPDDGLATRYINRYSDPFSHFVYGSVNTSIDLMLRRGQTVIRTTIQNHPLLAVAQGCTVRAGLVYEEPPNQADDVLAIVQLVERGGKLALVDDAEMEHHHASGLGTLYKKYWRRTMWTLSGQQGYFRRASKMARGRRIRRWLWLPYSVSLVAPAIHGSLLALRHRDPIALYHPVINTVIFAAVLRGAFATLSRRAHST